MTQCCSCCSGGVHLARPYPANRPGLSKLDFRLGTHGWFYKTMLSRLSSSAFPELQGLRTRETADFSIAFLDACSVVGDVLCFYQERIANEGYLDTATERLSLLELSRLIGYMPRPGVSASAYLAYTLENGAVKAEIPKGSKANTIPGPGEDMQAFETSEAITAREKWNAIKPRQTMPQSLESIFVFGLFLKGTATLLKRGDRLFLKFSSDREGWCSASIYSLEALETEQYTRVKLRVSSASNVARIAVHAAGELVALSIENALAVGSQNAAAYERIRTFINDLADVKAPEVSKAFGSLITMLESEESQFNADLARGLRALSESLLWQHPAPLPDKGLIGAFSVAISSLAKSASVAPADARQLPRNALDAFEAGQESIPRILTHLQPALALTLYTAWNNVPPANPVEIEVFAMRVEARPFGHNSPLRFERLDDTTRRPVMQEWTANDPWNTPAAASPQDHQLFPVGASPLGPGDFHKPTTLYLDSEYEISSTGEIVIETADASVSIIAPTSAVKGSIAAYGLSGKTVKIILGSDGDNIDGWLASPTDFAPVRHVRIFAGGEKLDLAERPIMADISGDSFELDGLYEGLEAGRWLVVSGERTDVRDGRGDSIPGILASELVMLAGADQYVKADKHAAAAGETYHTKITIAAESQDNEGQIQPGLAYAYKRDTVTINANVVKATHGETRVEVLGSGNAAEPFQTFALKQPPLTHVSAPTASGTEPTLEVLVNGVAWRETASLAAEDSRARKFAARTDEESRTSVLFGDGRHGLRLPTGRDNIRASYRSGIGRQGNVQAKQISLLASRPLGVKEVINPIRASGGADRESLIGIRRNAPASVTAFDRLVSVDDYADFARTFGGVGKADARQLNTPHGAVLHVTVTGDGDDPVDAGSDLFRNLKQALTLYGDEDVRIQLAGRKRWAVIISANVKLAPDCRWEFVEPVIRAALVDRFGFERMDLGGTLFLSAAFATMQAIEGVEYADIDMFDVLDEASLEQSLFKATAPTLGLKDKISPGVAGYDKKAGIILPAGLAYLTPDIPDTLILQEIKS
jgi:uncharacterized phage protein gp47/JayE